MLEHLGRKSGIRRYAVLEVVTCPRPGTYVVASGFGTRAQWFRNVRANPHVRVYAGGETTLGARISDQETSLPMIALEPTGGSR